MAAPTMNLERAFKGIPFHLGLTNFSTAKGFGLHAHAIGGRERPPENAGQRLSCEERGELGAEACTGGQVEGIGQLQ